MQSLLQCPLCLNEFDNSEHIPHMLTTCGHSLCKSCLTKNLSQNQGFFLCPEDFTKNQIQDIKQYPVNLSILKILSKQETKLCKLHNRQIELICLDDQHQICVSCALFGEHKEHNYQFIHEFVNETERTIDKTMELYQKMFTTMIPIKDKSINKEVAIQFDQIQIKIQNEIEDHFKEVINQVNKIKIHVIEEARQKVDSLQQQFLQKQQKVLKNITEKADLWMLSTSDKLLKFGQSNENQQINFEFMKNEHNRLHYGEQILQEIERSYQSIKQKISEIQFKQVQLEGSILKMGNYNLSIVNQNKKTNETTITQQSMIMEDPSLLREQSFALDVIVEDDIFSLGKSQDITPLPSSSSSSTVPSLRQSQLNYFSSQKKIPNLQERIESLLMDNKDSVDLCQLDILDKDAIYISSLVKEFKNVKKLNLMKNKISDIGGVKIIEMMLDNNISELNLQCNLITEKTLNQLLVLVRQRQKQWKGQRILNLSQNLIRQNKGRVKLQELKTLGFIVSI